MRCLIKHEWFLGRSVYVTSHARGALHYRTCKRCGTTQRGFDAFEGRIPWETLRERSHIRSEQIQIIRRPSSRLDQLAHTLRLRRTRTSDSTRAEKRSEQT